MGQSRIESLCMTLRSVNTTTQQNSDVSVTNLPDLRAGSSLGADLFVIFFLLKLHVIEITCKGAGVSTVTVVAPSMSTASSSTPPPSLARLATVTWMLLFVASLEIVKK